MNRSLLLFLVITLLTQSCSTQIQKAKTTDMKSNAELENTRWKLASLPGMKELPPLQKDTWIQFVLSTSFRGNAGCNNMSGSFRKEAGNKLSIGPVAMTRMMCPEANMKVESGVSRAINEVDSYEILGDTLVLKKGKETLATFAALYL